MDDPVDHRTLELLASVVDRQPKYDQRHCPAADMPAGALLAADVLALDGRLLLKAGQEITPSLRIHLQQHAAQGCLPACLAVLLPVDEGRLAGCDDAVQPQADCRRDELAAYAEF